MAKPTANLRLFVAIYPPMDVVRAMLQPLQDVPGLPAHRATPPEQVHLTLQFIGDTPAKAMDDVEESIGRATLGIEPFDVQPLRLIALPERGQVSRVLAVETGGPPMLLEVQRRLAQRLSRKVRAKPGDRYRPHMTICRFPGSGARVARTTVERPLEIPLFTVREIHLMRSQLDPAGAVHHLVRQWQLGAGLR